MANAIETYADLVYKKLKDVGFFDDEGQFDVTEELCLALNNLQVFIYLISIFYLALFSVFFFFGW